MKQPKPPPAQCSFLDVFSQQARDAATAHLPSDMEHGIIAYRAMLDRYHVAMLRSDMAAVETIYDEAHQLAVKLNGGTNFGIIADDAAPGCVLARETAAPTGDIPLWGQEGEFTITVAHTRVRIVLSSLFGIGHVLPGFSAHVVDYERPFISETGYRSFLGMRTPPASGMIPAEWVSATVEAHIRDALRGKLPFVQARYRRDALPASPLPCP